MFCTTFILVCLVGFLRPKPMNSKASGAFFWNNKVNDTNKYNFIISGDSRTYRGVSPDEIENIIENTKAKNLGFSSGGFNEEAFNLINKYLDLDNNNNIVVIGLTPFSLTNSAYDSGHLRSIKKKNIGFESWKINNLTKGLVFFDPIIPSEIAARYFGYGYYHKYYDNGWVESEKYPINRDVALKLYTKQFANNKFSEKSFQVLLDNIYDLTNKNVKVFTLRMPVYYRLKALEDSLSGFNENIIKSKIISNGGLWLNIQDSLYSTYDGSHLDGESARLLSVKIAKKIKSHLMNE
tara:strand:- start:1228 stop:2109 length:882 start_codon:yes stop_codon:yes gene_type:complete